MLSSISDLFAASSWFIRLFSGVVSLALVVAGPVYPQSAESKPKTLLIFRCGKIEIVICIHRGVRGTVVARWTAGQQVKRSIHQGHDSQPNSFHQPRLSPAQYSLYSAESWPKIPFYSYASTRLTAVYRGPMSSLMAAFIHSFTHLIFIFIL